MLKLYFLFNGYFNFLIQISRHPLKFILFSPKSNTITFTFTFMHLADAFIQSDLHCIQVTVSTFYQLLLSLGIEPMILALLAPCSTSWATGKQFELSGSSLLLCFTELMVILYNLICTFSHNLLMPHWRLRFSGLWVDLYAFFFSKNNVCNLIWNHINP